MKKEVKRKVISLETKIEILGRLRKGDRVVDVAKSYSMNESTIRTIRTNENTIRKSVAAGNTTSMGTTSYTRNIAMGKMEQALMLWIEDQTKRVPIDTGAITNKALRIYEKIVEQLPSSSSTEKKPNFLACHWFERFKIRHSLHSLKLKGEQASGDVDAAQEYPANFAEIINDNSYTPDQVFNADESGLFWKKMPERTYVSKFYKSASESRDFGIIIWLRDPGIGGPSHKAAKDRITILFCSNASGDYIMKPLVINKSKMPRAFKGVNINNLPVYWRANKKGWVTAAMFTEWFHECFIPDSKKYSSSKGLPCKVLLLIDNAPGHPQDLEYENVKVIFLPKNTTSLLQPLDQGIISTFKALYINEPLHIFWNKWRTMNL
ncbi:TIGD1 [Cordylochernes scorpioides]|uniref:TIGD1 n=1 Tax=Cordylochernes scorpioides TaxID=51811 RepID=A0ABY6LRY3_9ARAC|nr:TIGD1 [Cordylochernes scorpioides]